MKTLRRLSDYLNNKSQKEFDKDFEEVEDVGIEGPTIDEFYNNINKKIYWNKLKNLIAICLYTLGFEPQCKQIFKSNIYGYVKNKNPTTGFFVFEIPNWYIKKYSILKDHK